MVALAKEVRESEGTLVDEELVAAEVEYAALDQEVKCQTMLYCRLGKMYEERSKRITLALDPTDLRNRLKAAVARGLVRTDWARKYGKAPATHMERELQA